MVAWKCAHGMSTERPRHIPWLKHGSKSVRASCLCGLFSQSMYIYIYICENAFEVIAGQPCEPVLFLQLAIDALGMFMLPPHCRYA